MSWQNVLSAAHFCIYLHFLVTIIKNHSFLLPGPRTLFFDRYYFHRRVCVRLCVCLCVYGSIISKSYQRILMKFGRMVYNDKISVPFEDEMNRFIRTEVIEKMVFRHHELRPFDNLFSVISSPFLLFKRWNAMHFIR